jgi:4-amino-4-deoxy-L-arabinose transferase-like glycosyltransferase
MRSAAPRALSVPMLALLAALGVGLFARNFWTPDEPREADLAWRMSLQVDKAVPLLAGVAYCEKPPLTYWVAGAALSALGLHPWAARLPNLLYAVLSALAVGALARRALGAGAALVAAAAMASFLLSYQVAIWLATDAPLVAFDALALLGLWMGYRADTSRARLGGYALMHAALALGFLAKNAAAWMVPALTLLTLCAWEKRWRELARIELYAPFLLQLAVILPWVFSVYRAPDGLADLKVFFWNNLAGRFTHIDAPAAIDYTSGHHNSPGKYFIELPMYLFPWTLLVIGALRRAWQMRGEGERAGLPAVRFALASTLPAMLVLSLAATARNIYLAPALPGFALLLAWWWSHGAAIDRADTWLVRATQALLAVTALAFAGSALLVLHGPGLIAALAGIATAGALLARAARSRFDGALACMLLAWCVLLTLPAGALYAEVDRWQALDQIGRDVARDAAGRPLILLAPDETTLAFVDLYARPAGVQSPTAVRPDTAAAANGFQIIESPLDAGALRRLDALLAREPTARVLVQVPGRVLEPALAALARRLGRAEPAPGVPLWMVDAHLTVRARYGLPNGRRYALLGPGRA